jgi:hypothetical protein
MANSIAYVLSKNTYPDAFQANLIGVDQGTQIVYTTTSTLTTANVLYADSRLTQPIYGDGTSWYGVQLLTNTSVVYAITISESGVIAIGSGTTTTTAAPTTTTTAAPTTTTTAAPTTTTTTAAALTLYASTVSGSNACTQSGPIYTLTSATVSGGSTICDASSVTSPSISGLSLGIYYVSNGFDYVEVNKSSEGTTMLILNTCTSC